MHDDLPRSVEQRDFPTTPEVGRPNAPDDEFLAMIAELATQRCNVPFGVVALVDEHRAWTIFGHGLETLPRAVVTAIAEIVIAAPGDVVEVTDPSTDDRVALATPPGGDASIHFCAGVKLQSPDGGYIGIVAALAPTPGRLDDTQRHELIRLGQNAEQVLGREAASRRRASLAARTRRTEEQYRHIVENLADVVIIHDRDLNVQYMSPNVSSLMGYELHEISAMKRSLPIVDRSDLPRLLQELSNLSESNPVAHFETRVVRKDGTLREIAGHTKAIYEDGAIAWFYTSYRDNTEVIRNRDELAAVNASLSSMAESQHLLISSIGHDLSAPLAAIRIVAESINSRLETPSLIEQGRQLERFARQAEALAADLLRVTDPTGSSDQLEKRTVDLAAVVRDSVANVAAHQTVGLDLEEVDAHVDADAIARVVINLVTNAVKHTSERTPVSVSLRADDDHAVIVVADLGAGMQPSTKGRVLHPFETTTDPERRGSGLGLSIASLLTRAHHGQLTISDNKPHGTVVTVRLPRRDPAAAE